MAKKYIVNRLTTAWTAQRNLAADTVHWHFGCADSPLAHLYSFNLA